MLDGQIIYRDHDHFRLPGADVLYAALFKVFGVRAGIPQAKLILIGVVAVWLSIRISRALLAGGLPGKQTLLPGFLFLRFPSAITLTLPISGTARLPV